MTVGLGVGEDLVTSLPNSYPLAMPVVKGPAGILVRSGSDS